MYVYYNGDKKEEHLILAGRRKELKMTQQQVADKAGIQLRQYQRLEIGERNITGSTGRVLLAVCKALKLDPYTLVGDGNEPPEVKHIVLPPLGKEGMYYVIPAMAYYALVSAIPRGMVCSDDDLMVCLRKAYGKDGLEIESDLNSASLYWNDRFPFWRVVSTDGNLVNHIFCSKEKQQRLLEQEGVTVIKSETQDRFHVEDYKYRKFDIANVKVTIVKSQQQFLTENGVNVPWEDK